MTLCKDSIRQPGYAVLVREYQTDGTYRLVNHYIKDTMSQGCRQVDYDTLPECVGCTAEKDLEYVESKRKEMGR